MLALLINSALTGGGMGAIAGALVIIAVMSVLTRYTRIVERSLLVQLAAGLVVCNVTMLVVYLVMWLTPYRMLPMQHDAGVTLLPLGLLLLTDFYLLVQGVCQYVERRAGNNDAE